MCAAWVASGEHAVQSSLFVGHFCGSCTTHGACARGAATCGPRQVQIAQLGGNGRTQTALHPASVSEMTECSDHKQYERCNSECIRRLTLLSFLVSVNFKKSRACATCNIGASAAQGHVAHLYTGTRKQDITENHLG